MVNGSVLIVGCQLLIAYTIAVSILHFRVERRTHDGRTILIFAINGYWVIDRTMNFYACRYELENDAAQFH